MTIAPAIDAHYPQLTASQREVVGHLDGPLLVVAGPGSGKTYSIVLRALNLLLLGRATPREVVLCTFTEKAAFEMRDRLAASARAVQYHGDLSELTVSTIHGLCHRLLIRHRHRTELGHNFETLDELTQLLFIFDHFAEIAGPSCGGRYLTRWKTRWTAIEGVRGYFDKIAEEMIDPARLAASEDPFLSAVGGAFQRYRAALLAANRVDFAHLQRMVYDLLDSPATADVASPGYRYLMVDEYQDTNQVQEALLLRLAGARCNLCVVGDEDQSLYRFRGATVRNILEFPQRVSNCATVMLTTNYRSHHAIVERYDRWMGAADWTDGASRHFRHAKSITADPDATPPDYPAVISIRGTNSRDEAVRFADLVYFLKTSGVITDYSQVALLLHSVREDHSRLLALQPFRSAVRNENTARNLATFSHLLNVFQGYYHYSVVTHRNREIIALHFFGSFLRLLYDGGINEYEDPDRPFPDGHVQVMTIHQAKGLEFPVVVVGSLSARLSSPKQIDRDLWRFYRRPPFEPESRITLFDRMRLHYVAFSRPQKLLVLTAYEQPRDHFAAICQGLPQWPYVQQNLLAAQRFTAHRRMPVKKTYSFTGDLKIYETCPRQYRFFRAYGFTPSRSAVIFFGLLVHQSIEEIHRIALDGRLDTVEEWHVRALFDRTFQVLGHSDVRPIDEQAKESAFGQVINYFRQNREQIRRVVDTEVDVSLEKDDYILAGKVDLLLGGDGKLELLDFKTSPRPRVSPALIGGYERQLCTYAHILERRHGKRVDRMLLYWTAEARREDALMTLPYRPDRVDAAGRHFDRTVRRIESGQFAVSTVPEASICRECDLPALCHADGIIDRVER